MTFNLQINRTWFSFGIPLLMVLGLSLLCKSSFLPNNPTLGAFAVTFDLLLTVPLIYFFLIRKSKIPAITILPAVILGLVIATYILPEENQRYLNLFKLFGLPVIELSVISFVIFKVRRSINNFKLKKEEHVDFYSALKIVCADLVPKTLVPFLATEIAVIYYGFINWKKYRPKTNEFSYHKNSGTMAVIAAVIVMVMVETFVFHLLLAKWSITAAWILSALSAYTGLQLFGFLKSLSQRPIIIAQDTLLIRYGILAETKINIEDIARIELSSSDLKQDKETKKLSTFGDLESHNTIIILKKEYRLFGLYGTHKQFTKLALHIDNKEEFKNKLELLLHF